MGARGRRGALARDFLDPVARPVAAGDFCGLGILGPGSLRGAFRIATRVFHTDYHDYLRYAARLETYRIRHRDRFHLCRDGAEHQRRLISPASRPRWRGPDGGSDFHQGRAGEPFHHGAVGIDRRVDPVDRLLAAVRWARDRGAGPGTFELASLPEGRGTGRLSVTPSQWSENPTQMHKLQASGSVGPALSYVDVYGPRPIATAL